MSKLSGVVAVTAGSAYITGTGTRFKAELAPGDRVRIGDGEVCSVDSVRSDTALTLTAEHAGPGSSGLAAVRI